MKKNSLMIFAGTIIFLVLFVKLIDFTAVLNPEDTTAQSIKKTEHKKTTVEGFFLDADGKVIFAPQKPFGEDDANMPVEYSYLLGYNSPIYGSSGLRSRYSEHLYNDAGTGTGGSIQLTVDGILQTKAYAALQERDLSGSIVVMNARNGEILAMAGRRGVDYNLNQLDAEKWSEYNGIDAFFVSPATGDFKAPGSVFKVVTSAAAIVNGMEDFAYEDTGTLTVGGQEIHNAMNAAYGMETLQSALIHSTNTYFGSLSLELGERAMREIFDDFLLGKKIDLGFTVLNSSAKFTGSDRNLAMVGFGQGGLAVSPLHIAMIGQSIVNDGKMIKPTLIKAMYDAKGKTMFQNTEHELLTQAVKPHVAEGVRELMLGVTREQQPKWLEDYTENIYVKTGTAQGSDNFSNYNSYYLCMTDEYVILISINNTQSYGGSFADVAESFLKELY